MIFDVVKFENGRLTTQREQGRHEDFFFVPGRRDGVEAWKHFGDHEYDTGTTVDLKRTQRPVIYDLLDAANKFHAGL